MTAGTLLWCLFTTADLWACARMGDPSWTLVLRAIWAVVTVVLLAGGHGVTFFVANTLLGISFLALIGFVLAVSPPPLARDLARSILMTCLGVLVSALCWALN